MLALSRKTGEQIVIPRPGGDIIIHVLEQGGSRVRFGFVAPPEVSFYRKEIWDKMTDQQKDAARNYGKLSKERVDASSDKADQHPDPDLAV